MALETYWAKRDFRRTPEPRGSKGAAKSTGDSFVVQKHAATRLHYDFRLEMNGVLLSWAVPKGPSFDPADKRLAMHVEDHPLEYGGFEGVIPKGEYGGGTVMVWDRGTWHPQGDAGKGYAEGHIKFTLDGDKLKGSWALVRTRSSKYGGKSGDKAWLLIKEKDEYAQPGGTPIVESAPNSVLSGRAMEEIADARDHVWSSNLSVADNLRQGAIPDELPAKKRKTNGASTTAKTAAKPAAKTPATAAAEAAAAKVEHAGEKAPFPEMVAPTLATLVTKTPSGDDWISEIKYDGYRMVCRIERGAARLYSRTGKEWTPSFETVADDLGALPVKNAWIDGEVVVLGEDGRSSFQALQNALSGASTKNLAFFAFDLLYRDGHDLRALPLTERKALLREVIGDGAGSVRFGPEVRGNAAEFFRQACALHLEGVICKRADSTYEGVRSRNWLKVKCMQRQEMVVGGYTDPQGSRQGFGALLLGHYDEGGLRFAGKVGTGFDDTVLRKLTAQLKKLEQDETPFVNPPQGYAAKGAHWVLPELVAEIAFAEWSDDGALRHPSFQGLRMDRKPTEVVREMPVSPQAATTQAAAATSTGTKTAPTRTVSTKTAATKAPQKATRGDAAPGGASAARTAENPDLVAGVKISNPDKLYFPEGGLTKRDVALYLEQVAPQLVPHVKGRPLSLVRCPDGWTKQCFYQKHADRSVNEVVPRMEVPEGEGTATYMGADSAKALVALLQWGVIELHPWGSRVPQLDRPDRLVFDFDPDEDLPWKDIVTAAGLLRTLLDEMKLVGFLKTTGGKGLHVVLPIRATLTWDDAKSFTKAVADFLVRTFPDRFTAVLAKERRKGKIFIDYLRNAEGATAIAAYALRARANAPVATPIDWSELDRDVRFDHFNIRNVPERIASQKADPWAAFFKTRQSITLAMKKRLG
ncbi:MAG: DNA ligase D [Betaproteobacteria bacterium]